ncbi:MAG: threonine synthase [Candidatus Aenigmatarchaeota archaeon]|nr:MAG: threonine synthase [Candidatus Aenigmarchaeota archaeon]
MYEKFVICSDCGRKYPLTQEIFRCKKCGGSVEIIFDYAKLRKVLSRERLEKRPFNHMRYKELYPVKNPVTIGEGGTALVRSKNIERVFNLDFETYFKYEAQNPTGSFKDRGSSIEVAKAVELGKKHAVCASTGNMGASVSAYCSVSGISCSIIIPKDAVTVKIEQILAYGSSVYRVKGDYTIAERTARDVHTNLGAYLLGDYSYRREGTKSVGFEIAEQINPDWVICPVGNGTLISAVWKAFKEFKTLRFIKKLPKLVGIQASGCNPVVKAFKAGKDIKPVKKPKTVAVAIECGNPLDGKRALSSVVESDGFMESVSDRDILKAREILARMEGLFAGPAGAASLAGLLKCKDRIEKDSKVVCVVTGHGLKTPHTQVKGKPVSIRSYKDVR